MPKIRAFDDISTLRTNLYENVISSLAELEAAPVENERYQLRLSKVRLKESPIHKKDEKKAILEKRTLATPVLGKWDLIDKATGKAIDSKSGTVMEIPYVTDRGTVIYRGNEYTIANQARLKSGVYTRLKENGELEAHINIDGGSAMRMQMDPSTGAYFLRVGQANTPLYPILRHLGVTDRKLQEMWGEKLLDANRKAESKRRVALQRFYRRLDIKPGDNPDQVVYNYFKQQRLNPYVLNRTLGVSSTFMSPEVMLATSQKLLNISRGEAEPDDRDAIQFQTVVSLDDMLKERIQKDAGNVRRNMLWRSTFKNKLVMPSKPLNAYASSLLLNTGLGQPLTEISPLDIADQQYRLTRLGEGGIGSLEAIPKEAQGVQATYTGFVDPIRGPESARLGVDMRVVYDLEKGPDGKLYRKLRDVKTGKTQRFSNEDIPDLVIAFPGEMNKKKPIVGALKDGKIQLVNSKEVTHELPSYHSLWNVSSLLVPMPENIKGGRILMAGKFFTQALPLANPEIPLVQTAGPDGKPMHSVIGDKGFNIRSDVAGQVLKVTDDEVVIRTPDGNKSIDIYNNLPFNYRTFVHSVPTVAPGDVVKPGQLIAHSNFTDKDGNLAIGANLKSVPGHSKVLWIDRDNKLRYTRIDMVDPYGARSFAFNEATGHFISRPIKAIVKHPIDRKLLRFTLASGRTFIVSDNHSLMVMTDEGLKELTADKATTINTYIPRTSDLSRIKNYLPVIEEDGDEIAWAMGSIVGAYLAAGRCDDKHITFDNLSENHRDMIRLNVRNLFNQTPVTDNARYLRFEHGNIVAAMRECGLANIEDKDLDDSILFEPYEFLEGFVTSHLLASIDIQDRLLRVQNVERAQHLYGVILAMFDIDFYIINDEIHIPADSWRNLPWLVDVKLPDRLEGFEHPCIFVPKNVREAHGNMHYIPRSMHRDNQPEGMDDTLVFDPVVHIEEVDPEKLDSEFLYDIDMGSKYPMFFVEDLILVHNTAYMEWKGKNYEDAIVVTESGAKKLAAEVMVTPTLSISDKTVVGKNRYRSLYPAKFKEENLSHISEDGVVKPGSIIKPDQPLILAYEEKEAPKIGALFKGRKSLTQDASVIWDRDTDGIVTDVAKTKDGILVSVKTYTPLKVGSKITGRAGDKGVCAEIVPDDQAPKTADGEPVDIILSPLGIISRGNPAQIYEAILGKIAKKTGKPYVIPGFSDRPIKDFVREEMQKHGISDVEEMINPDTGKPYDDQVLVGYRYFMAPYFKAEEKLRARETGRYTIDRLPARGGKEGAKRISLMEINALISHGATDFLRDSKLFRGQSNEKMWQALKLGRALPSPEVPFVYKKFLNYLRGAGVNVKKENNQLNIMAMTDKDVTSLSSGELQNSATVDPETLKPVKGGMFDPTLTGGHGGQNWAHINLSRPMPNPVMEEPIRRMLGLTKEQLSEVIGGKREIEGQTGPNALRSALERIDVGKEILQQKKILQSGAVSKRDNARKVLGYLKMMQEKDLKPSDMMLTKFPVLPPIYRPIGKMGDVRIVGDPNYFYKTLFELNDAIKTLEGQGVTTGEEDVNLYKTLVATAGLADPIQPQLKNTQVQGLLAHIFGGRVPPKYGDFQRKVLGMPVDLSARATITPDPSLSMDEVAIPKKAAWEIFKPFVIRDLIKSGMSPHEAAVKTDDHAPVAERTLHKVMGERPVVINRAPTLHKFGIMGSWAKLSPDATLHISPVITSSFGADFDGDEKNFHVPVTKEGIRDVLTKMMPSLNLFSPRDSSLVYMPTQGFTYGLWKASKPKEGMKPIRFGSDKEALEAFQRGMIKADTPIIIAPR